MYCTDLPGRDQEGKIKSCKKISDNGNRTERYEADKLVSDHGLSVFLPFFGRLSIRGFCCQMVQQTGAKEHFYTAEI